LFENGSNKPVIPTKFDALDKKLIFRKAVRKSWLPTMTRFGDYAMK